MKRCIHGRAAGRCDDCHHRRVRRLIERRMALANPGDTISKHPDDGGPPTLYEVAADGSLVELEP